MDYALRLHKVSKKYARSEFALEQVSFALPTGAVMGFVGENGAGKTTTIGCILNTLKKDKGTIEVLGKEIKDEDISVKEELGIVYDGDNFPGYLTAKQLAKVMEGTYKKWDNALFQHYLKKFRINANQKIAKYSKGMTMKLAIAAALSHHPRLLIMDEATSGLDPVMREEILDVFLEFVGDENCSILMSSHITSDLERIADYITFIHDGKIILTETKDNLIYNYAVLRCKEKEFENLSQEDVIAFRRKDYQIDVSVLPAPVFAVLGTLSMRKETTSKWYKYKLSWPVKRKNIVQSYYISHLLWCVAGMAAAAVFMALTVWIHGNQYFYYGFRDAVTLVAAGGVLAIMTGSVFYPLYYVLGAEKTEITTVISVIASLIMITVLSVFINLLAGDGGVSDTTYYISLLGIAAVTGILFGASYKLSAALFQQKEY